MHNQRITLDELWGTAAIEVQERLLTAPTIAEGFRSLEQMLLAQAIKPLRLHPAVTFAVNEFQQPDRAHTVSEVTAQIGFSARHFIQLFREQVGLTPKLFCRVQRFQQALGVLASQQEIEWAELAADCGYFDQAHFINEFRTFSGLNPTTYLMQRGENPNHLPLLD